MTTKSAVLDFRVSLAASSGREVRDTGERPATDAEREYVRARAREAARAYVQAERATPATDEGTS
jgi:hypothetical protein